MSELVESPIEADIMAALKQVCWRPYKVIERVPHRELRSMALADEETKTVFIAPQQTFSRWRADFMLATYCTGIYPTMICVECDGHAFHKATRQQMERDAVRDRVFQINHIRTLRFSGKEIMRDPYKCAKKAISAVTGDDAPDGFHGVAEYFVPRMSGADA